MMQLRRISVTALAREMGRHGDLGRRHFSLLRGVEGIQVHQRMQQNRGEAYQAEFSIRGVWEGEGGSVEIFGRMDGVETGPEGVVIEELKTSRDYEDALPFDYAVHALQAELYAWLWLREQGGLPRLRLEYVHPDPTVATRRIEWQPQEAALNCKMAQLLSDWMRQQLAREAWIRERNQRLQTLTFPFTDLRPGQSRLLEEAASVTRMGGRLFVQAPTGIGKTIAILFPAFKALGEGHFTTLFIATCRNTGKRIFEEAAQNMFPEKPGLRMLTLVAKERICHATGSPCDCESCPLALGFYDRLAGGMAELREQKLWTAEVWQQVAATHRLCPFGLMMHAAREADVIVGDLNYALDPAARLEFLFGNQPESLCLLIDEAHHLPDRSRAMISAALDLRFLQQKGRELPTELRSLLHGELQRVVREMRRYQKESLLVDGMPLAEPVIPEELHRAVCRALDGLEASFQAAAMAPGDVRLDLFRTLNDFRQSMEHRQPSHVCTREETVLHHLCLDAGGWLGQRMEKLFAVILFSGTLIPLELFMIRTGAPADARKLSLSSPYEKKHFRIELEDALPLVWKARGPELYERLTGRIVAELTARAVKTLVFFPSYALMDEVHARMPQNDIWLGPILKQPRGLQEEAADDFLGPFREAKGPVTGLAVLGGALNEGIDLPGEALEAVIVVSIGLPGISRERELMRRWYDARGEEGFMMAYTLPGLLRVLQAMGRVIRGPQDRGTALLIDPRFKHPVYREWIFDE